MEGEATGDLAGLLYGKVGWTRERASHGAVAATLKRHRETWKIPPSRTRQPNPAYPFLLLSCIFSEIYARSYLYSALTASQASRFRPPLDFSLMRP